MTDWTVDGTHQGAILRARSQPALSLAGRGGKYRPCGEDASWAYLLDTVLPQTASACPLITASTDWPQPGTSTLMTSFQVRPPKARNASMFWLSAGAPFTNVTRLPLRSAGVFTPETADTATC